MQSKLACRSPIGPGDVTRVLNLRYVGYLKNSIIGTTRCIICGTPYTLTHLLVQPRYRQALEHVTCKYEAILNEYGVPIWWRDWARIDSPLLTALRWVPAAVEKAISAFRTDRSVHSNVAGYVLDAQLHLVRALLSEYAEHAPADGRPLSERMNGPGAKADRGALNLFIISLSSVFIELSNVVPRCAQL